MKEKKKRGTAEKRLLAACVFLAGAGILIVCARQVPGFAEWYAVHIYQKLTAVTGRVTGLAPFSVVEIGLYVLLILLPVTGVGAVVKSVRFGQGGENALCWASGLFLTASALLFLYAANCGVNYQRESFSEKTGLAAKQYTAEDLKQVCLWLTEEVNALAGQVERGGSGEMVLALEELAECIPDRRSTEDAVEAAELKRLLNQFLGGLSQKDCSVFLRRYWYVEEYSEIAKHCGMKLNTVKTSLYRTRTKLREYLEQEGVRV